MTVSAFPKPNPALFMRSKLDPIIIIDPEQAFIEEMYSDPQARLLPPIIAGTAKEAQQVLTQFKDKISGIFISLCLPDANGGVLARLAKRSHPEATLFFIHDRKAPYQPQGIFSPDELKTMGVQSIVKKPIHYTELLKLAAPNASVFDPKDALEAAKKNADQLGAEVSHADTEFFPTSAHDFLSGSTSYFDVYVRIGESKYLKILRAGDAFTMDRLAGYLGKGVTHFYLRKEVQSHYINYADKVVSAVLKSPKVTTEIKISQAMRFGEDTINFLRGAKIGDANLQYARSFVDNVDQLIKSMEMTNNNTIKGFVENLSAYDHGMGVTVIASLVTKALNFEFGKALHTVGLGALFHDLGLYAPTDAIKTEDESLMTEEEKKLFYLHPTNGAMMLQSVSGIGAVVCQAIEQHHERRNKGGFPKQLGKGSITQVAEIVGISDEFFRLLQKKKEDPTLNLYHTMVQLSIFEGFSPQIGSAFKSALFPDIFGLENGKKKNRD